MKKFCSQPFYSFNGSTSPRVEVEGVIKLREGDPIYIDMSVIEIGNRGSDMPIKGIFLKRKSFPASNV